MPDDEIRLVSVVIPTYKRPMELKQALNSVIKQTYKNIEVIIVFDGEDTLNINERINDIPVQSFGTGEKYGNGSKTRNFGAAKVKTKWIAFLDDDDIWAVDKLEKQISEITKNTEIDFLYTDFYLFDQSYSVYDIKKLSDWFSNDRSIFLKNFLIYPATGSTSSYLIRTKKFREINGFNEKLPTAQDYDLALRLFHSGAVFHCIPEPLLFYRTDNKKVSIDIKKKEEGLESVLNTRRRLFSEFYTINEKEILSFHIYSRAFAYLFGGQSLTFMKLYAEYSAGAAGLKNYIRGIFIFIISLSGMMNLISSMKRHFFGYVKFKKATAELSESTNQCIKYLT